MRGFVVSGCCTARYSFALQRDSSEVSVSLSSPDVGEGVKPVSGSGRYGLYLLCVVCVVYGKPAAHSSALRVSACNYARSHFTDPTGSTPRARPCSAHGRRSSSSIRLHTRAALEWCVCRNRFPAGVSQRNGARCGMLPEAGFLLHAKPAVTPALSTA